MGTARQCSTRIQSEHCLSGAALTAAARIGTINAHRNPHLRARLGHPSVCCLCVRARNGCALVAAASQGASDHLCSGRIITGYHAIRLSGGVMSEKGNTGYRLCGCEKVQTAATCYRPSITPTQHDLSSDIDVLRIGGSKTFRSYDRRLVHTD